MRLTRLIDGVVVLNACALILSMMAYGKSFPILSGIVFGVAATNVVFANVVLKAVQEYDQRKLNNHLKVLEALSESASGMYSVELAKACGHTKAKIRAMLDELWSMGLVEYQVVHGERPAKFYSISELGRKYYKHHSEPVYTLVRKRL